MNDAERQAIHELMDRIAAHRRAGWAKRAGRFEASAVNAVIVLVRLCREHHGLKP